MKAFPVLIALSFATPATAQLDCNQGPLLRTYGGTSWLVYACNDDHSLIFVSSPSSKASPFVFSLIHKEGGGYQLHGEGTGDKGVTDAAAKALQALDNIDIEGLLRDAARVNP